MESFIEVATTSRSAPQPWTIVRQPPDLEQVFIRYADPVYRFFYSRLGNREDAEDLTSEVFLKASRQLDPGRAQASVAAWLFTVAGTVLADHGRWHSRAGTQIPIGHAQEAEMPDTLGQPERSERLARSVAEVLDRLPARYRRVLELRFLSGYSIRETAQAMGITPVNVKVIQHRALAKAVQMGEGRL